ncbi:hypothetical protein ABT294_02575 [Nonomuraea sp. NPDC000554]|uniref:hypothetical protein n=1 Tax=Nonomuraea sp. NPDC000554 TaxID=3154259 RepID=UPI0033220140
MLEQPWSVVQGAAVASLGSMLLGMGRARYAALLIPLMYGRPDEQREAARVWEEMEAGLRAHPAEVEKALDGLAWTGRSAQFFDQTIAAHTADTLEKADSPKATAHALRVSADVYDTLGYAAFGLGTAIFTAGVMHRVSQVNPFLRPAAEVGATIFGRQADRQAGQTAARARAFMEGGRGVLGSVLRRLAQMSPRRVALLGGAAAVVGGMELQSTVASGLTDTAIKTGGQA